MKWYEGNIAEAVQKAQLDGAVFGVAILGDDESSRELEATLNADEVHTTVCMWKFVFIRIAADSETHQQFAQIYSNAVSPSVYLIGDKGSLLEVVSEPLSSFEMKEKLNSAWKRHCAALEAKKAAAAATLLASGDQNQSSPAISDAATAKALLQANEDVRLAENAANEVNISVEDKIERAQRLVKAKREQKMAEEAEEKKRKERERRDMGRGLSDLKRLQADQEAKQLVEERKKEKQEEADLRKKLKEQIAADRVARNARSNVSFVTEGPRVPLDDNEPQKSTTVPVRPAGLVESSVPKDYSGQARLQFRLPAGTSISQAFEPVVTLSDVRSFLVDNNHVPYRQFTLSIAYPRRQFTSNEYSSTLRDLGLVPSAALLVLPLGGSTSGGYGISGWLNLLLKYLIIPFTFIYNLFRRALPSSGRPSAPPSNPRPSTSTAGATPRIESKSNPATAAAELRRRNNAKSGETKKSPEGNVHRLRDNEDSDEEKATWNGNSTQQM